MKFVRNLQVLYTTSMYSVCRLAVHAPPSAGWD